MSKLSLEGREKLRKNVEELLKTIPDNKKIQLPNETLEQLLFEEVIVNKKDNIRVKFPVWSGKFLRKLDLSRVDFKNVTWDALSFIFSNESYQNPNNLLLAELYEVFLSYPPQPIYDNLEEFNDRLKNIKSLKRLSGKIVDYSYTNVSINLSDSFEQRYNARRNGSIEGCDFRGCDVYFSKMPRKLDISNCNFANSSINLPETVGYSQIRSSNFENCNLSNSKIDITTMVNGLTECNFNNTGATIIFDEEYCDYYLLEKYKNSLLIGCRIADEKDNNDENDENNELKIIIDEIYSLINNQQEDDNKKKL